MKSLQFYGPKYAILPFSLAAITAFERVKTQKHFASDVIASFFITVMASEGVRLASKYEDNHPLYRFIFENNFKVGLTNFKNTRGLKVQWDF
jgi:undecaprenyl-diphosphatase